MKKAATIITFTLIVFISFGFIFLKKTTPSGLEDYEISSLYQPVTELRIASESNDDQWK